MSPKREPAEPIAIIGMGMRLPGGISTAKDFWELLINKKDARCRVPENRYNLQGFFSDKSRKETVATEYGYFLEDVNLKAYDTSFFSANQYETQMMDPQQRLLLEVVWECIENAGVTSLQGTNTGVYVGSYGEDWNNVVHQDTQTSGIYRVLNTADFILSNRISYQFDLRGPSVTVRTACSAAMTGLHMACQALYNGDCPTAIVAGSSLILSPSMTQDMSAQGVLSPTGICKTFDEDADGFGRAEGINAILIKPLKDALRDNDPIRAIIRSTAINSDGKTSNIGVPSPECQEAMIRHAYEVAGITDLSKTAFVECHGTGTPIGDPLEAAAVGSVFGERGVKPNIGHTEGASGITGIIKAVLALENEIIPPNIHFATPNPKIPFEKYKLEVPVEPIPWPKDRHARVSSIVIGQVQADKPRSSLILPLPLGSPRTQTAAIRDGTSPVNVPEQSPSGQSNGNTNGHVTNEDEDVPKSRPLLLAISASNEKSLKSRVADMQLYIESRVHLAHRTFCIANGTDEPLEFNASQRVPTSAPGLAFVFTGQGAQWAGMGKELFDFVPSFRQDIQEMDRTLQNLAEPAQWTIQELLCSEVDKDVISKAEFAQPLSTAVQLALVNLLAQYGVTPSAVVGHSSGEIAAAYVAGALTMSEAIICSYLRGLVTKRQARAGRMAAVGMSRERVTSFLVHGVHVACENSPKSVTLSGDADALEEVIKAIKAQYDDVFVRQLRVDKAYHSHHMCEVGSAYEDTLAPYISAKKVLLPFYSTVTGCLATPETHFGAAYWRTNVESPVLFDGAVQSLLHDMKDEPILIEIGPHSALQGPLRQIFQVHTGGTKTPIYVPTLLRDENALKSILTTVGQLYSCGHKVDFSLINPTSTVLVDLPTYPWDHTLEHWHESRISLAWRSRAHPHHELLGAAYPATGGSNLAWRNILCSLDVPWLKDHLIANDVVFPCAAYIAMIGEAIRQATGSKNYTLRNLVVKSALVVYESETIEIMTIMNPVRLTEYTNSTWCEFSISSFNGSFWVQHCIAEGMAAEVDTTDSSLMSSITSALPRKIPQKYLYEKMKRMGLNFGPRFRLLQDISAHTEKYIARATIQNEEGQLDAEYATHPSSIDACMQLSAVATNRGMFRHLGSLKVPSRIGRIYVSPGCPKLVAEAIEKSETTMGQVDIIAVTTESKLAVKLEDVKFIRLDTGDADQSGTSDRQALGRCEWRPDIDFYKVEDTLHPGPLTRDLKVGMEKVTALCILRLLDVIKSLGVSPPAGHFTNYVSWLEKEKESMLRGEYQLVPDATQWASTDAESRKVLLESARADVDSIGHQPASAMVSINYSIMQPDNIKAIFSGEMHPLQLYLEEGRLAEFYNYCSQLLDGKEFYKLSAHSRPNMKVLEIGAGTGGTTVAILKYLTSSKGTRMYSQYMFTDISSGFFANAQERLDKWEGIEYKVLDITKDPAEQGFTLGEYDLVLASNVLHATPSLHETLKNVRSLIRPGGRLYLQELITPTFARVVPFIAGMLSGWWLGENDGRADQAIVSIDRWDRELRAAGFCGVEAAVADDDDLHKSMAHIISVVPTPDTSAKEITFLYNEEKHQFARELATVLEQDGAKVHWRKIGDREYVEGQDIISTIELEQPYFQDISEEDFANFMACVSQLKGGLLWLTRAAQIFCTNPTYGLVLGFARTVRVEASLDFWTAELQNLDSLTVNAAASITRRFLRRPLGAGRGVDCEFSVHDGTIQIGRYDWSSMATELESQFQDDDPRQLVVGQPGMLDSLHWVQHASPPLQADEVEVSIRCTGLNFRDIMVAMGILEGVNGTIGYEGAGVVTRVGSNVDHVVVGDRVLMIYNGLFTTRRVIHGGLVFRIPQELSFEGAATMAIVYCTVVHAVINKGELESGQSILIHSACGGVGLAALQICKMLGAEVYTTVGNEEKVQYLVQNHGLPRERIFNSRNASFYDDVMRATKGRGVDMVLNSLSGDLLHASWCCVAKWGRMMEIGKRDIVERGRLALDMFSDNRTYYGINLDGMFERPKMFRRLMEQVLQYYSEGHIKPIEPIHTFPAQNISEAFRYMQKGQHMGKIVITMPEVSTEIPAISVAQEVLLSNSSTYLMVGGLGGLGKVVTTWMVEKGARSFVFLSRSAGESAEDQAFLLELRSQGCSAIAVAGSVVDMGDVTRAIEAAPTTVAGVVQMPMALRDLPLLKINHDDWKYVQGPKVTGTWNLHKALSGVNLDFFILFGSLSAVFGQPGQASYSSANAFQDAFVQYRHGLGLPCSVIDIGAMDGVGVISRNFQQVQQYIKKGLMLLQEQDLMDAIQLSIKQSGCIAPDPALSRYTSGGQFAIGMASTRPLADPGNHHPIRKDIRMGLAWQLERSKEPSTSSNSESIREFLSLVASEPEMLNQTSTLERLTVEIGQSLCGFMLMPEENLDMNMTLDSMGVDSLVSIEIRNWWRGTLGVDISVLEIANAGTIARLGNLALASLKQKYEVKKDDANGEELPRIDLVAEFSSYMGVFSDLGKLQERPNSILPPQATVFLTGASGYLGAEILRQLLRHDAVKVVVVLVRAKSVEHGMDRIRETAQISGWWLPQDEARVEIWLGDLSTGSLGLDNVQLARLGGKSHGQANIDAIIHNGALVSMNAGYEMLRAPNIESTVELLKLAVSSPVFPKFIYISGSMKIDSEQPFKATAQDISTHPGYSQTKIMAERIVLEIASRMPVGQNRISVVKPGLIAGTVEKGVTNVDDALWHFVAIALAMKKFPVDPGDGWIYISGVDDIATRITEQLFATESMNPFVDIMDGMLISRFWELICEELTLPCSHILWDDWVQAATTQAHGAAEQHVMSLIGQLIKSNSKIFQTKQSAEAQSLLRTHLAIQSSVRYLKRIGFIRLSGDGQKTITESTIKRTRILKGRRKIWD
ncbi:Highly reducing polyketide synthase gloL [Cladobotryum mycophilum]|uniref:Highly reducing polyketide synthase gloL n=1 Tax=Cladobotryum mycophilum TaxID=491253 RepID=A0ABR0SWR7_9HYPO